MIKHIKASNILSFGPDGLDLELKPLNVLIGANGSGKSNFLDLIDLMRSTPNDLQGLIRTSGGTHEWIWKLNELKAHPRIELVSELSSKFVNQHLLHSISFNESSSSFFVVSEAIMDTDQSGFAKGKMYYDYFGGHPMIDIKGQWQEPTYPVSENASILAQRRDPETYLQIASLADFYEKFRIYRDWTFGRKTNFRRPQPSDQRNDRLEPDFSNIGLFLNRLRRDPKTKRELIKHLQYLYEGISDFEVNIVEGGYVQILFTEGDFSIPASRLSDGTLRYLCLLAILLDPNPPALICIEEPELGLHPDILPHLTDLLVEASERTQLIVTTHSQMIVDSLSEQPESVLVCEKHNGQTKIERLSKEKLGPWLEEYSLGDIWSKGEIGGNRW